MVIFKTGISKKERIKILGIVTEFTDIYRDFYLTKNNLRLFIRDNLDILFKDLRKGDKIAYDENGVGLVVGYSDKAKRKYIKLLAKDSKSADRLIKVILWNEKIDLWAKIKRNSIFKSVLERNNFRFEANRGKEILLVRRAKKEYKHD